MKKLVRLVALLGTGALSCADKQAPAGMHDIGDASIGADVMADGGASTCGTSELAVPFPGPNQCPLDPVGAGVYIYVDAVAGLDATIDHLLANATKRNPGTQLAVARTLLELDRNAEARKLIGDLVARHARVPLSDADTGDVRFLEGVLASQDGNSARALELFDRALAADPRRHDACANAISLLLADGSAIALMTIPGWLDRIPAKERWRSPSVLYNEAAYLVRVHRIGDARARLERVLELTEGEGDLADAATMQLEELSNDRPDGGDAPITSG